MKKKEKPQPGQAAPSSPVAGVQGGRGSRRSGDHSAGPRQHVRMPPASACAALAETSALGVLSGYTQSSGPGGKTESKSLPFFFALSKAAFRLHGLSPSLTSE